MKVSIENLVPISEANQNFSQVARKVDRDGTVVILKNNKPRYVLVDYKSFVQDEGLEMEMSRQIGKSETNRGVLIDSRFARASLEATYNSPVIFNPVFLYGPEGIVRNELINETVKRISNDREYLLLSADELSVEVVEKIVSSGYTYVIIDKIDELETGGELEKIMFDFIDTALKNDIQLVFFSEVKPDNLELNERIVTRLGWGVIVDYK